MSKRWIKAGVIDQTIDLFILDSSSTTGAGLTGLTSGSSGLTCYYRKGATGTATALTLASQTVGGAHTDGGFVAIDGTNMPGLYRLDLSDTMVATAGILTIYLRGAANMAPVVAELEVVSVDIYDSTRFGLSALPNAAAEALGGLATLSANQASNGTIPVNLKTIAGQTANASAAVTFPASIGTSTLDAAGAADAVWDEVLSGHLASGSTGAALNAAGAAGDPWSTSIPGTYGAGTAGYIVGTNLDAAITSRLASGNVTVGSIASNAITAASINNGAITTVKFAGGAITSAVLADNSITADKIAAGAITASEVSTEAAQEIANAVWSANINNDYAISPATAAPWGNNTFGDRVVISDSNNQNEVAITGSNHIAADIHEIQPDEIIDIAQGVLTEATSTNPVTYAVGDVGNVLGRLANMIAADGADFQYTANALELAPSGGGGGGGSTTVRMGPFVIKAEGQGSDEPLDINKGATHAIECQLVDAEGTGVDITGATLTAKVYNSSGSLIETVSGTISYAALGQVRWIIGTTTTNTAGTYTVTITRTTGASDTQIFGPLRVYVRDI